MITIENVFTLTVLLSKFSFYNIVVEAIHSPTEIISQKSYIYVGTHSTLTISTES